MSIGTVVTGVAGTSVNDTRDGSGLPSGAVPTKSEGLDFTTKAVSAPFAAAGSTAALVGVTVCVRVTVTPLMLVVVIVVT